MLTFKETDLNLLFDALHFAAEKHRHQRRKDQAASPYINHLIDVVTTLWNTGEVRDMSTLLAAILHDTLEDTTATPEEIESQFGSVVLALVREVTDDKSLPKAERKRRQVEHASHTSLQAQQIKLADKISNVYDIIHSPAVDWMPERRREYIDWAEQVVSGMRGANPRLELYFDKLVHEAREMLNVG